MIKLKGWAWIGLAVVALLGVGGGWLWQSGWLSRECRVPQRYSTIQAAIEQKNCATILVAAGVYKGGLKINRRLELRGEGAEKTIIDGRGQQEPAISIELEDPKAAVLIVGFKVTHGEVRGSTKGGVWIGGSSRATLKDNVITQNSAGVQIWDSTQVILENNTISENEGEGVFASGESQLQLRSNQITKNNGDGVSLQVAAEALITGNQIIENTGDGITIWESSRATVEQNTIQTNWLQGISVGGSAQAAISDNDIRQNGMGGLIAGLSASVTLKDNQIFGNGWYGLNVVGEAQVEARGNVIFENFRDGVGLEGTPKVTLEENKIYKNRGCGILAQPGVQLQGARNQLRENGADLCKQIPAGLRLPLATAAAPHVTVPDDHPSLQEAIDAVVPGGEVVIKPGTYRESVTIDKRVTLRAQGEVILQAQSDKATVVSVLPTAEATLEGLTIMSGFIGVMIHGGKASIQKSKLTANWTGLIASGEAAVSVQESEISGNFWYGMSISGDVKLSLHRSKISNNRQQGVSLNNQSRAEVVETIISGHRQEGLSLAGSSYVRIQASEISDNQSQGISARETAQLELRESRLSGNREAAVILVGDAKAIAFKNEIFNNGLGLLILGRAAAQLQGNAIQDNEIGIEVEETAQATLRENVITRNGHGVLLTDQAQVEIYRNMIRDSRGWGIAVWTKSCFPDSSQAPKAFMGRVKGTDNQLNSNRAGDLCGALLK